MAGPPKTPLLTVDVVIEVDGGVVLIERRNAPRGWALPGGFVDVGETVEAAAIREAKEETGLDVALVAMLGVYSDPSRDPRGHTVSVAFVGRAHGEPHGADDAARAIVAAPGALPAPLCFDHGQILDDYRRFRATGERLPLRPPGEAARAHLDDEARRLLLRLARDTLVAHVQGARLPEPDALPPALRGPAGAFVSLHRRADRALRGCIGTFRDTTPLWETVREMTVSAAVNDPRFPGVRRDEVDGLHIEISVLGPRRAVRGPDEVEAGRHGVWIERGAARGVLLPQVATEAGWSARALVEGTCTKAGLPSDAWREPDTSLSVFEALVFGE